MGVMLPLPIKWTGDLTNHKLCANINISVKCHLQMYKRRVYKKTCVASLKTNLAKQCLKKHLDFSTNHLTAAHQRPPAQFNNHSNKSPIGTNFINTANSDIYQQDSPQVTDHKKIVFSPSFRLYIWYS